MGPEKDGDGGQIETGDESNESTESAPAEATSWDVGSVARQLNTRVTARERTRLPLRTLRRIGVLALLYATSLLAMVQFFELRGGLSQTFLPSVILVALLFEFLDSAAGMGFGTTLAPLLFLLGYDPLQVIPVLLITETMTGIVSGAVHQEMRNVSFSIRPPNDATKLLVLFGGAGAVGSIASIVLAYYVFELPEQHIETYVLVLVLLMGVFGLVRSSIPTDRPVNSRILTAFAVIAGINKGIGGGGYGPVVTVGQIVSGVYEKSATAIASLSESVVSFVGVVTFVLLSDRGGGVDLTLFPSIYAGGIAAAIAAPYLVRVVPNRVLSYLIPLYAVSIGLFGLTIGLEP